MSTREVHPRQAPMLRPGFDQATVAQAMHFGVLSCRPEATLAEVAAIMATHHVHAVVVDGIRPDEPLSEAARIMRESDVHHLVVVDPRTDRPIGILSTLNVAIVLAFGGGAA